MPARLFRAGSSPQRVPTKSLQANGPTHPKTLADVCGVVATGGVDVHPVWIALRSLAHRGVDQCSATGGELWRQSISRHVGTSNCESTIRLQNPDVLSRRGLDQRPRCEFTEPRECETRLELKVVREIDLNPITGSARIGRNTHRSSMSRCDALCNRERWQL